MTYRIPVYQPDLAGNTRAYVNDCLDTNWISSRGKYVTQFEDAFAQKIGTRYSASVSNGTVALHVALLTLGIGPGDEVIVPTLTYIASANAVTYTGATPVFADSDKSTWQLDPGDVERCITERTKAIMPVHLYGQACDMDALGDLATKYGLSIIEDCAEAFGTHYRGKHVGGFGQVATFSFYGNKTITTGEGGMVVTNDRTLHERAKRFRGQGLAEHREYWHDIVGYNYRMTNIAAAIGLAQLERGDELIGRKKQLAAEYREALEGVPLEFQGETDHTVHSYWMFSVLVENASDRDPLRAHLAKAGIETRPLFYPVHTMPMYARNFRRNPTAEDISWRGINLPSWPGMSAREVQIVSSEIRVYFDAR